MDRTSVVNYCLGLLSLLILQGALSVDGRSTFNPGNRVFNPKEDTEAQSKILALLLHKSLVSVEKDDPLGLELANKLAELEELRALREDLELERQITANLAEGKALTQKRGEPCFWKYCV
ncbi:urotensin 2 domain containing [Hippoglossus hippoglossus]|uniref:urotensin 2 domain containing n=1 Tax=Hippoglossus hippoglossus TaxID=8267 RepID=UPI00148D4716|nr:urotensin 2 domain containing [Hippoglossus hippoglossus]XP_034438492.1 urotensin 2 domain containing [Hippoglossus hippoglossus]XP_035033424.1 urotensin 2 domain containing [Hippoglossus stenolepis]